MDLPDFGADSLETLEELLALLESKFPRQLSVKPEPLESYHVRVGHAQVMTYIKNLIEDIKEA